MPIPGRTAALAAATVSAVFAAAACGTSPRPDRAPAAHGSAPAAPSSPAAGSVSTLQRTPGDQVVREAVGNTLASPSFSFTGQMNTPKSGPLGITVRQGNGLCEDTYGTVDASGRYTQGTTTVIDSKNTVWLSFSPAWYYAHYSRADAARKISALHGRYLQYPASAPALQPDVRLCDLQRQWAGWPAGFGKASGRVTTLAGQPAYELNLGDLEIIDVTVSARPRLLTVSITTGEGNNLSYQYSYSTPAPHAPAPAQSVKGSA